MLNPQSAIRHPQSATRRLVLLGLLCCLGCGDQLGRARQLLNELFPILAEVNDNLLKVVDEESAKDFVEIKKKKLDERLKNYEDRVRKFVQEAKSELKENKPTSSDLDRWELTLQRAKRELESFLAVRTYNEARLRRLQTSLHNTGQKTPNLDKILADILKMGGAKASDMDYGFKDLGKPPPPK